jgi:hypothetical protein
MTLVSGGKSQVSANTSSIQNGDNIASYLLDSAGNLIASTDIGGTKYLNMFAAGTYAEDSAHVSGDYLHGIAFVRNDAGTALAADGDYIPPTTDSSGNLRVSVTIPSGQDFTHAEDDASSNGAIGALMLCVRKDIAGTQVSADGDYSWLQQNKKGSLRVSSKAETAILQQIVTVGTTAVQLPATSLVNRESLLIQMLSGGQLYIGSATVTNSGVTRGIRLGNGGFLNLDVSDDIAVYGIADAAGKEVAILEVA